MTKNHFPIQLRNKSSIFSLLLISFATTFGYGQSTPDSSELGSAMTLDELKGIKKPSGPTTPPAEVPIMNSAAEPSPALRYRFYPSPHELKPGQAQPYFAKAVYSFYVIPEAERKAWNDYLIAKGDGKDKIDELRKHLANFRRVVREMNEFGKYEDLHWDYRIRDMKGIDMFTFTLPETNAARDLARIIKAEAMVYLADRDFPKAFETIQNGIRLAEYMGQGETIIQKLVGLSIESMMHDVILEAVQTPDCPNLYWALATVPQPLVKMQPALQFELSNAEHVVPAIAQAEDVSLDQAGWRKLWQKSIKEFQEFSQMGGGSDLNNFTAFSLGVGFATGDAKNRLLKFGYAKEKIDLMYPEQILAIDSLYQLRTITHELSKLSLLPADTDLEWQSRQEKRCFELMQGSTFGASIARLILPAVNNVRAAETRSQMAHNRLMTMEAIRMHLASQKSVPVKLNDLVEAPAMSDPFSNQPFDYLVSEKSDFYEITLKSKESEGKTLHKELTFKLRK